MFKNLTILMFFVFGFTVSAFSAGVEIKNNTKGTKEIAPDLKTAMQIVKSGKFGSDDLDLIVTVGGGGGATYASLTDIGGLFHAINSGLVTEDVIAVVIANTVETGAISLLQFAHPYKLFIVPGAASVLTLEATTLGSNAPMMVLDGADNVIIDGRFGGAGRYLRFVNNNATPSATGPILRFINDARANGIGHCILESNASNNASPMIQFSNTTGPLGNDSIAVDSCLFQASTGTNPGSYGVAIGSTGAETVLNEKNSAIAIIQNNITGWLPSSNGAILFNSTCMGDSIVIDSNRIYNDVSQTTTWIGIGITSNTNNSTINFNSIGGSNPDRSGNALRSIAGITMSAISMRSDSLVKSDIQGNRISNFANTAPASVTLGVVNGIVTTGGDVNIGTLSPNIIGGGANPWDTVCTAYDNGWIFVSSTTTNDSVYIWNNTVSHANYWRKRNDRNNGIRIAGSSGRLISIRNNLITNMKGNGIGNSTSFQLMGIAFANSGGTASIPLVLNIYENTIHNLVHNTDTASSHEIFGIIQSSGSAFLTSNIYNNKIYNLQSNANTALDTGTTAPVVNGIRIATGLGRLYMYNNAISLASQVGNQARLRGIVVSNTAGAFPFRIAFNSVYLGGFATGSSINTISFGFLKASASKVKLRSNIFYNDRTGGNRNLSIGVTNVTNWSDSVSNNNLFVSQLANNIGDYNTLTNLNFTDWKTNSLGDIGSLAPDAVVIPSGSLFTDVSTANLNINNHPAGWYVKGQGSIVDDSLVVTTDYVGGSRPTTLAQGPPTIGCYEVSSLSSSISFTQNVTGNGTYDFTLGGKPISSVVVSNFSTPFQLAFRHFSGVTPPNIPMVGNPRYAQFFDSLYISSGSLGTATYEFRKYYYESEIGNVLDTIGQDTTTLRIAKSNNGGLEWIPEPGMTNGYTPGYPGYVYATDLNSFSIFTITGTLGPLPVELASFTAFVDKNNVDLKWTTSTEINNSGFDIERKLTGSNEWTKVAFIEGNGNSNEPKNYSFVDKNLATGKYNYRLKQIDYNGNFEYHNLNSEVNVGIPSKFDISQNYPNPFNPATRINYDLPIDSKVSLKLYDMLGREVYSAVNNELNTAGYYTVQLNLGSLSSGTYFYRIIATGINGQEFVTTKKMQLLK